MGSDFEKGKGEDQTVDLKKLILELQQKTQKLEEDIQLKNAELRQFENISKFIPGAFFQFRADNKGNFFVDYLSEGAGKLFYRSFSELIDFNKIKDYLHPDDADLFLLSIKKSKDELSVWDHSFRVKSGKEDTFLWIHGKSIPEKKQDGSVVWNGLLMDITRQKEDEEEKARAKEKYEFIVNKIIGGYARHKIIYDKYGNAVENNFMKR